MEYLYGNKLAIRDQKSSVKLVNFMDHKTIFGIRRGNELTNRSATALEFQNAKKKNTVNKTRKWWAEA